MNNLLTTCIVSLALGLLVGSPSMAAPEPLQNKIITALGGEARLRQFQSFRARGTFEGVSGFPGTFELIAATPDRLLLSWDIGYLQQTMAVEGNVAWERSAAVREVVGDELARAQREARFNLLYGLLRSQVPMTVKEGECSPGEKLWEVTFAVAEAPAEVFGIDQQTFLPVCEWRIEQYQEGPTKVRTEYRDYRRVGGLQLPFEIRQIRPDGSRSLHIARYDINPRLPLEAFRNPERAHLSEPITIELATLPERVYKEGDGNYTRGPQRFWGMYFYPSESFSLDIVVRERHGRYLEPQRARAEFFAQGEQIGVQEWNRTALLTLRRYPVARFTPQGEIYGFRHNFSFPREQRIDRIVYHYEALGPRGELHASKREIPITLYRPKTSLIFPMKGKFLVTSGHEYYETEHKYERSQQFAIDVVALGENFEFASNGGARSEDFVGYARREIIAPADGKVAFARNDIPDGIVKAEYLKMENAITAPAGNVVIIDHGNQEFSIFCHMHFGSVRVKTGDAVRQGQVVGLLGAAGSPGSPHLHYQLQNGPNIFGNDGLPLVFTNIERAGWGASRGRGDEPPVEQPRSGVYMEAR